ncbi:MAG: DUF4149 domain-containing protein [Isosphaerales bacterium]
MTSRYLLAVFDSVYVVALAAWVGSSLFFSFGLAPIIFKVLGAETGGKFVRAVFPRYYLWGAISGSVALPAFVAGPLCYHEYRGTMVGVQALAIISGILIMLYGGNSLTPAINQAREGGPSSHERCERLHRRAVRLNVIVMFVGLSLLVGFATRPAPRTSGIIEMTPAERVRYDAAINRVIHDVEAKYGMRPPRVLEPGETTSPDPLIDLGTIEEIESYYARKHQRDEDRARRRRSAEPASRPGTAVQPAPPPNRSVPQSRPPASSGES